MAGLAKHRHKYAPLSDEARAWEKEQLRAMGLEDVEWNAGAMCPWCRGRHAEDEPPRSGVFVGRDGDDEARCVVEAITLMSWWWHR